MARYLYVLRLKRQDGRGRRGVALLVQGHCQLIKSPGLEKMNRRDRECCGPSFCTINFRGRPRKGIMGNGEHVQVGTRQSRVTCTLIKTI